MNKKFQDKIKPGGVQAKAGKEPVELIAIPIKALPLELVPPGHNGKDEKFLVFTGAVTGPVKNIFYSHQSLLIKAGYNSGYNLEDKAIKFTIPQVHEKKRSRFHNSYFAPAQSVAAAEIKDKFPNAKITYVNSVEELAGEYRSLVAQRQEEQERSLQQERLKLIAGRNNHRPRER